MDEENTVTYRRRPLWWRIAKRIDIFLWLRLDYSHLTWRERWDLAKQMTEFGEAIRGEVDPLDL